MVHIVLKPLMSSALPLLVLIGCGRADVKPASFNLPEEATRELRELFHIGDSAEGVFFTRLWRIQVMRDGNLVVFDSPNHLYEFDPDGALVNVIGREGRGPGEFHQYIDHIFLTRNDTLHVIQTSAARHQMLVKSEAGTWQQYREREFVWTTPASVYHDVPEKVIAGPNGSYFGIFPIYASLTDSLEGHDNYYVAQVDHNLRRTGQMSRVRRIQDLAGGSSPYFFRGYYNYDPFRDEVFYITNTSNEIVAIDSAGTERVSGHLPYDRFSMDRDSVLEARYRPRIEYFGSVSAEVRAASEEALLPHEPYYWQVLYDQEAEQLWLNLARSDGGPNWVITNLEGEVLGSFYGPRFKDSIANSVVVARGNRIYGAIRDSNGVDYLAGYELVESGE